MWCPIGKPCWRATSSGRSGGAALCPRAGEVSSGLLALAMGSLLESVCPLPNSVLIPLDGLIACWVTTASYSKSLAQATSYASSGRMADSILSDIDLDIEVTLPQLKMFQSGGPMHEDLHNLLLAYSVFWKREPSYASLLHESAPSIRADNKGSLEAFHTLPRCCSSTCPFRTALWLW